MRIPKLRVLKEKIKEIVGPENVEFLAHSKNYLSADVITMAFGLASVPIFTRLLAPSEYGILSIFLSFTSVFGILLGLNITVSILRYYHEKNADFKNFLGSNLIFMAAFNVVTVFVLYFVSGPIAQFAEVEADLVLFSILLSASGVVIGMYLSYLVTSKQSRKFRAISVVRSLLVLVLSVIWVWSLAENRYWGRIYAPILVTGVLSLYALCHIAKLSTLSFSWKYVKYSLKLGIPLIPHSLSGIVLIYFDRVIINQLVDSSATGLYQVAYRVGMLMYMVVIATSKAWIPLFFENLRKEKYDKLRDLAASYSRYIYFAAAGLILFSREAVVILAHEKFHGALSLVPIIVLSYVFFFLYTLYGLFAFYRKKTILISMGNIIACGTNIGLNYWLIPRFGYEAAAYTTLVSYILLFVYQYLVSRFVLGEKAIPLSSVMPNLLLVFAAAGSLELLNRYVHAFPLAFAVKVALIFLFGGYFLLGRKDKKSSSGNSASDSSPGDGGATLE